DFLERASARMEVTISSVPDLSAEQLVERHLRPLGFDVPQRNVDTAHRVEEHRPVAPVRAHVARLPDVLDLVDVAADEKWLEVLLDRGIDDERALGKGGAAPSDESWLGRFPLHDQRGGVV